MPWRIARRAGRRTNLALLVLLALTLATGALAFALGNRWSRWVVAAHGAVALGMLLLVPWKSVIVRRGLRRRAVGQGSGASLAFAALVAVALAAGVGHSTALTRTFGGGITAMQVHVGAALASVPLAILHVVGRRVRPRRTDLSRRALLRSGALAAGSLAAYGALAGGVWVAGLPGRFARFTGSYERGSNDQASMPVTQWLNDGVPAIDSASWLLTVMGRDGRSLRAFDLADVDDLREPIRAVIDCTGGWYAEQAWDGVRLDRLLAAAGLGGAADEPRSIRVVSVTGYWRRYPSRDASRLWLCTRVGGSPLSAGHGFPARVVAPGRRGFWWVKWVRAIEISDVPWWWQPPFPVT